MLLRRGMRTIHGDLAEMRLFVVHTFATGFLATGMDMMSCATRQRTDLENPGVCTHWRLMRGKVLSFEPSRSYVNIDFDTCTTTAISKQQ